VVTCSMPQSMEETPKGLLYNKSVSNRSGLPPYLASSMPPLLQLINPGMWWDLPLIY
jgi:hypothetical protein